LKQLKWGVLLNNSLRVIIYLLRWLMGAWMWMTMKWRSNFSDSIFSKRYYFFCWFIYILGSLRWFVFIRYIIASLRRRMKPRFLFLLFLLQIWIINAFMERSLLVHLIFEYASTAYSFSRYDSKIIFYRTTMIYRRMHQIIYIAYCMVMLLLKRLLDEFILHSKSSFNHRYYI